MKKAEILLLWLLLIGSGKIANAQKLQWEVAVAGGAVYNIPTNLTIEQADFPVISLRARYHTEPFVPPVYYDVRVAAWRENKGWNMKFTHHKIILDNRLPEVQRFSITDGFNLLTINRLWRIKEFELSAGAGIVITHPESTVRGRVFPESGGIVGGYFISGPTIELALAKRLHLGEHLFLLGEGRLTGSYVQVPIEGGDASVPNAALNASLGLGYRFKR